MSAPAQPSLSLPSTPTWRPRKWAWRAAAVAAGATVVVSLGAWAAADDKPGMPGGMGHDHHGHHGHHGPHDMGAMPPDAGGMLPFGSLGGHRLQRMLDEVKATDAQRTQIKVIAEKAQSDVQALRVDGHKLREQSLDLWAAPQLDAVAAEALRQQTARHHEQVSQRMAQAMLDVGQVLTPAQRAGLVQHLREHRQGMLVRMRAHLGGQDRRNLTPAGAASTAPTAPAPRAN